MREVRVINEGWQFTKKGETVSVNLPHTWNGTDGQDGGNDYARGTCVYEKQILDSEMPRGEEVYLQADGVNASAVVYLNGEKMTEHHGGYSTFRTRLTPIQKENVIRIEVDNSACRTVYPQQADFTFYGGIYRDVSLIGVPKDHFDLDFYGGPGLSVKTKEQGDDFIVTLTAFCEGTVRFAVMDGEDMVGEVTSSGKNPEGEIRIPQAHRWDGRKDPHLYRAEASLISQGEVMDEVSLRFGCRTFEIDPQSGFILNGRPYPLRGVSRHQDRPGIGNALRKEHHREDMDLICEMGANSIRLAHYQHAQSFYDLCDERGMVVWAEIPYISEHMPEGKDNTLQQMKELIIQNAHHASIAVWGLSNEITMGDTNEGMIENHKALNDLAHELDPSRLTTVAVLTTCSIDDPYHQISDVLAYNHYFGWYGGKMTDYGPWFDTFHKKYPNRAIGMSEYGCEALNWHNSHPEQGDYTEEYQALYHETVFPQIMERPYIWGTYVWNMFDFAADSRSEGGENGINHKGLVTLDRKYKKDAFYFYQACLSEQPMLHICSKRYIDRVEEMVLIKVYSNQDEVELFADGVSVGKQKRGETPVFEFSVVNQGETKITASAGGLTDESLIRKVDTFNEAYRLKEEGAVLNWFEITAPEGFFSINDTLGDIFGTLRGKLLILKMVKQIKNAMSSRKKEGSGGGGFSINKSTMKLAMGFTVKRAVKMVGVSFSKEELLGINARLNKIKKPKIK